MGGTTALDEVSVSDEEGAGVLLSGVVEETFESVETVTEGVFDEEGAGFSDELCGFDVSISSSWSEFTWSETTELLPEGRRLLMPFMMASTSELDI